MGADELAALVKLAAPNFPGLALVAGVVFYVVRVIRAELRESRAARASTSTVGGRLGDVEHDLTRLEDALAAQGLFVPGVARPTSAGARGRGDDDDQADDVDVDLTAERPRVAVPPLPPPRAGSYARHARQETRP